MGSKLKLNNANGKIFELDHDDASDNLSLKTSTLKYEAVAVPDRATLLSTIGVEDGQLVMQNDISLPYTWNSTRAIADDNGGTVIAPTGVTVGCWEAKYSA